MNKSTLDGFTTVSTAVAVNGVIPFATVNTTGCSIKFDSTNNAAIIATPGLYEVTFNGYGATTGTTGGTLKAQLANDNTLLPCATASSACDSSTDVENLSFTKIIRVKASCCMVDNSAVLQVLNTGGAASYGMVHLTIVKLA